MGCDPSLCTPCIEKFPGVLRGDLYHDHALGMDGIVKLNHSEFDPAFSRTLQGLFLQLHPDRGHNPADPAPL